MTTKLNKINDGLGFINNLKSICLNRDQQFIEINELEEMVNHFYDSNHKKDIPEYLFWTDHMKNLSNSGYDTTAFFTFLFFYKLDRKSNNDKEFILYVGF